MWKKWRHQAIRILMNKEEKKVLSDACSNYRPKIIFDETLVHQESERILSMLDGFHEDIFDDYGKKA